MLRTSHHWMTTPVTQQNPYLEVFEMQLLRVLDNLIWAFFSQRMLDLMIFQGSFQPGLSYD